MLGCISFSLFGANTEGNIYWIQLNIKAGTPYSISKPEFYLSTEAIERRKRQGIKIDSTDLPVNPVLVDSLHSLGFTIKHTSRWMNGVIASLPYAIDINSIKLPSFVKSVEVRKNSTLKSSSIKLNETDSLTESYYGSSDNQITMLNGQLLHNYSKGKGVKIAVIDAGFLNVDSLEVFNPIVARNGILGTCDFVNPGGDVYKEHHHGTNVLSIIAANQPGKLVGTAPEASYWLLRSEDADNEYPLEEDYWIIAAEFADRVGCSVINSSLGYTVFDDSTFDHNYEEFTGDSLRISKAANIAVKKGIVVVCSAGNDGNKTWHYLSAPAEARDVLCVAAVDGQGNYAPFSSYGFGNAEVPKPDIAAKGSGTAIINSSGFYSSGSGTSFSAPVISGLAACLVGIYPDSSATSIIRMIREAGNLYPEHNDSLGYGLPNFEKLVGQKTGSKPISTENVQLKIYPNPCTDQIIVTGNTGIEKVSIFSCDGRLLISTENKSRVIPVKELPQGVYIVKIRNKTKEQTFKLIKK